MPLRRISVRSSRCTVRRGIALAEADRSSPLPKLRHAMVCAGRRRASPSSPRRRRTGPRHSGPREPPARMTSAARGSGPSGRPLVSHSLGAAVDVEAAVANEADQRHVRGSREPACSGRTWHSRARPWRTSSRTFSSGSVSSSVRSADSISIFKVRRFGLQAPQVSAWTAWRRTFATGSDSFDRIGSR